MTEQITLHGTLTGHGNWVTQIATTPQYSDLIWSASRDKTLIQWKLTPDETNYGFPQQTLRGHGSVVSDVAISSNGQFALSGSWDGSLRLWDLSTSTTTQTFTGHTKAVFSVAYSPDNLQIVSGSQDKSIKFWNIQGVCEHTIEAEDDGHSQSVTCVRFSPNTQVPTVVSCGWDKTVKVWNSSTYTLKKNHTDHTGHLNVVAVSPNGSKCASGGKDKQVMMWDLEDDSLLYTLDGEDVINSLCFSPNRNWLCAATGPSIKVWDLEGQVVIHELEPQTVGNPSPQCTCLAWSTDGQTLFAGYTDNVIRVWQVSLVAP